MADLSLKLVINGSNDGALAAINQVIQRAESGGAAISRMDNAGGFSKTRAGVESISTQLARLQSLATGAFSFNFLVELAKDSIKAADEMKGVDARLKLASRSWQEYGEVLQGIKKIAFDSGTAIAANVSLVGRISDPIRRLGGTQSDILMMTQAVNDSLRLTNASAAEAAGGLLQFSQAMGAGVLRGDELNSVIESMPRLAQAIAEGLGITIDKLKSLGEQGALTSQQVFEAIKSQQDKLRGEAASLPPTVGQAWTNAQEAVKQYVFELDKGTGATSALASAINTVAQNIPAIAESLKMIAILAGVAFGARLISQITASVVAMQAKSAAERIAAADAVRRAESELAVASAVARKAAAELAGIRAIQSYTLATNEAAFADEKRAAAARLSSANQAASAAASGLVAAQAASSAANVGLMSRAMGGAAAAGRGLLAIFGGPWGAAITAITAGAMAWDFFSQKSEKAADDTRESTAKLIKDFQAFSKKAGPAELAEGLEKLRERESELNDQLLNPSFRISEEGRQAQKDLGELQGELDNTAYKMKVFDSQRVVEKGHFGLDKLKQGAGGLIDADFEKSLKYFSVLWTDFSNKAATDAGKLKMSALEARAVLSKLFADAKTPADFAEVITRIEAAMKASKLDNRVQATLKSYLENAIEQQFQTEMKALDALTAGLQAKAQRTQGIFQSQANVMLAQYSQAAALARVKAELNQDVAGGSKIEVQSRNAELAVAVTGANQQVAALEKVAQRKRDLVNEELAQITESADSEIAAAGKTRDKRIEAFETEVAAGKRTAGQLADYKKQQEEDFTKATAGARAARENAEKNAAQQIAAIDGTTAQERVRIAENLYKTLGQKANEALNQYKQFAQQVQQLDKSIQNNQLDTMSQINGIARQGMKPGEQLDSLRDELAQVRQAADDALKGGKKDYALELIGRAKSVAGQMSSVNGEGVDPNAARQEAIDNIAQLGAAADEILQKQRAEAAAAAAAQMKQYEQMTGAMTELAGQITKLNEQAAVKLKPEIDKASLDGAIAAVKTAFENLSVPVKVTANPEGGKNGPTKSADGAITDEAQIPARAYGGPLPGTAPHDRADNMLYWGTPGEWVVQLPAVRHYGPEFMKAVNAMQLPKHAFGGQLGNRSVINRLSIPSFNPGGGDKLQPLVLDLGFLGRFQAQADRSNSESLTAAARIAALRFGRG